jgi:hypothetical protein
MEKKLDHNLLQAELEWKYLLEGSPLDRMNHARQFRKNGKIEL